MSTMAERTGTRSRSGRDAEQPSVTAREAIELARECLADMTDRTPLQTTSVWKSKTAGSLRPPTFWRSTR